jgi:hypothetical protein
MRGSKGQTYDVEFWLKYFLLRIQGNSLSESAEKLRMDESILHAMPSKVLSDDAKKAIRHANGWKEIKK